MISIRDLSYRAPNRGAVCGMRLLDTDFPYVAVSYIVGFRIMYRGII